jgi:polyisoprenoid-binding protein YceI
MRYARSAIAAMIALAALATPVVAQMVVPKEAPGKPNPALATSGRYTMDPAHSQVIFTVTHLGWTNYTGQFTNPTGTLVLDSRKPATSKVEVTFPIDKVLTTVPALDTHLKSADFFDAAKYPTATFVSTRVVPTGAMTATITGNLTIKGVTKTVVLKTRFIGAGNEFWGAKKMALGFAATTSIKRSDFGMGLDVPLVSDNIDLVINAGFEAE